MAIMKAVRQLQQPVPGRQKRQRVDTLKRKSLSQVGCARGLAAILLIVTGFSSLAAETNAPSAAATTGTNNAPATAAVETNTPPAAVTNAPPPAPPPLTPEQMFEGGATTFNNWVDLAFGGFITEGNKAQFQQTHQHTGALFGGFEDFHVQEELAKGTTFTADGHALIDERDYKLSLGVTKEKLGYLRFSYNEFRTWYNGNGGFYPPTDMWFPLASDALGLDRGQVNFEGGLLLDKMPKITFKYTHNFRTGEKSSTDWGLTHPDGGALVQGIAPSFYDINERSDAFQLDVTHKIKATDLGLGVRYEFGKLDDALKIDQFPGEPIEQKITDRQGTTYDMFSAHAFSETWIKKNLMLSTGFSYSDLDNDFTGSRIYGTDFDVNYVPAAQNGLGYYGLTGSSRLHDYVGDVNLLYKPLPALAIVPSIRVQQEDWNSDASGFETLGVNAPVPFSSTADRGVLDVRERLDLTYNGVTNWVFYGRGELTQGSGNLNENGGLVPVNGIGLPPIQRETDDGRFFQKYSAGARWYPARQVIVDGGGYYKLDRYDYNNTLDSTPNDPTSFDRYPAFLVLQDFETFDGNLRLTLRPLANVTLVSRYEYQLSTIHTAPDPISGLPDLTASKMTSHIIAQDISWTPWSRLYLQVGFNYVLSETKTPASEVTQAILNSQNNYWTLNFSSGLVLDDKTDLKLSYFYYLADDYQDNSNVGLPLGTGAQEHGITATLSRQLSKHVRWSLRYGYYHYTDPLYGGNNNYSANVIYTTLRYLF
jgi:hypothetical protein